MPGTSIGAKDKVSEQMNPPKSPCPLCPLPLEADILRQE